MNSSAAATLFSFVLLATVIGKDAPTVAPERAGDSAAVTSPAVPEPAPSPQAIPAALRAQFDLAPFYQKHVLVGGMPIVGSAKVHDAALAECAWIVSRMLESRPDILQALARGKVRFAIMAHSEYTTDIPEHAHLSPRVYWDRRARGLGATPSSPAVSAGEESLLALPGDPYPREIIAIHEFAHAIHEVALRKLDPTFDRRLSECFKKATAAGLWKSTYAASNRMEYWAEAVQSWFDNNDANNALHNEVDTREELERYDPEVAALCREVFGRTTWRYAKPANRSAEDRAHLAGFDSANPPRFVWRKEPTPERARLSIDCPAGNMVFELTGPQEKLTELLEQCHLGIFSGGRIKCTADNVTLTPGPKASDGTPTPPNAGGWSISNGTGKADGLRLSVIKGDDVLTQLRHDEAKEGSSVQRVVRLN